MNNGQKIKKEIPQIPLLSAKQALNSIENQLKFDPWQEMEELNDSKWDFEELRTIFNIPAKDV